MFGSRQLRELHDSREGADCHYQHRAEPDGESQALRFDSAAQLGDTAAKVGDAVR